MKSFVYYNWSFNVVGADLIRRSSILKDNNHGFRHILGMVFSDIQSLGQIVEIAAMHPQIPRGSGPIAVMVRDGSFDQNAFIAVDCLTKSLITRG